MQPPDLLDAITQILLDANKPTDSIAAQAPLWNELLQLIDPERQPPDVAPRPQGYRVLQEFPFVAATPEGALRIEELLAQLGLEPGHPYARYGRVVVPVYSNRYLWLGRLLELTRKTSELPQQEHSPDDMEAIMAILRQVDPALPDIEERARTWASLRPLIARYRRPAEVARGSSRRTQWELTLVADNPDAAAQLSRGLRAMGLEPGRPFAHRERVVLPVPGEKNRWFGQLLALADPPEGTSRATRQKGPRQKPVFQQEACTWFAFDPALALAVVTADSTFQQSIWQGRQVFAGRCAHCSELLLVGEGGEQVTAAVLAKSRNDGRMSLVCMRCAARSRASTRGRSKILPKASPAPVSVPEPAAAPLTMDRATALAAMAEILREEGQPADTIDERVRAWCELSGRLSLSPSRPGSRSRWQEFQFMAASPLAAARLEASLNQLGVKTGRPIEKEGRILLPVDEKRYPWLGKLLTLARAPSPPAPDREEALPRP